MATLPQMLKSAGPRLVPFFKTAAIYFVVFNRGSEPTVLHAFAKCLPIISLMFFVAFHGGPGQSHKYSRRILAGLAFSCLGDAFLCWPNYFLLGMAFFSFAHVSYTAAFGMKPLNLPAGVVVFLLICASDLYLWPGLAGVMAIAVPMYGLILGTMVWRAAAKPMANLGAPTWSTTCAIVGAIAFVLSDFCLGVDRFVFPLNHAQLVIMLSYYTAQLGIALSVMGSTDRAS